MPYDKLYDMDEINGEFDRADVALVIGANDVVNPAARNDKASPIYGMPILNADHAKSVIVLKRGMAAGFAGIENELFYDPKTLDAVRRREDVADGAGRRDEERIARRGWRVRRLATRLLSLATSLKASPDSRSARVP